MLQTGKLNKNKLYSFYQKVIKETEDNGYTEEQTKEFLLKFMSLEELKYCEKITCSTVDENFQSKLEELKKINKQLDILSAIAEYNDYLLKTNFKEEMTKTKYERINRICDCMKEAGMEKEEIITELRKNLTKSDINTISKYIEIEENIEFYEDYKNLTNSINLHKNKGHRIRRFTRGKRG